MVLWILSAQHFIKQSMSSEECGLAEVRVELCTPPMSGFMSPPLLKCDPTHKTVLYYPLFQMLLPCKLTSLDKEPLGLQVAFKRVDFWGVSDRSKGLGNQKRQLIGVHLRACDSIWRNPCERVLGC